MAYPGRHRWTTLLVVVAVLVVAADALLYGHVLGCSAGLFALLLSTAVMAFGTGVSGRRGVAATAVLLGGLLVALVLEPGTLALGMTVFGLVVLVLFQRHGGSGDAILWLRRVRSLLLRGAWQWARDLQCVVRITSDAPAAAAKGAGLRRWLPAFGLGVVFLALFALANPVLAGWLAAVADRASYLRERAGTLADAARARLDRQLENWRGWTLRRAALRDGDRDAGSGLK